MQTHWVNIIKIISLHRLCTSYTRWKWCVCSVWLAAKSLCMEFWLCATSSEYTLQPISVQTPVHTHITHTALTGSSGVAHLGQCRIAVSLGLGFAPLTQSLYQTGTHSLRYVWTVHTHTWIYMYIVEMTSPRSVITTLLDMNTFSFTDRFLHSTHIVFHAILQWFKK